MQYGIPLPKACEKVTVLPEILQAVLTAQLAVSVAVAEPASTCAPDPSPGAVKQYVQLTTVSPVVGLTLIGELPVTDVTAPEPEPHAPLVVVNRPPVPACTQLPAVRPLSVTLVNEGAEVTATVGVAPVPTTMFEPAVSPVTVPQAPVALANSPPVLALTQSPEVRLVSVTLVKEGAAVTATDGEAPVPTCTLDPAVSPVTVPQALAIVVSRPPVLACTQLPLVRLVVVRLVNDGAFVIVTTGVAPEVTDMLPPPVTAVTPPALLGYAHGVATSTLFGPDVGPAQRSCPGLAEAAM